MLHDAGEADCRYDRGQSSSLLSLPIVKPLPVTAHLPLSALPSHTLRSPHRRRLMQGGLPLLASLGLLPVPRAGQAAALKDDESVLALPGILQVNAEGPMQAHVHLWVYEDERRPGVRRLFARYLGIDLARLDEARRQRYIARAGLFLKDSERGKVLRVRLPGGAEATLPASDAAGRTSAELPVPREAWDGSTAPLDYTVLDCPGPKCRGQLWPVPPQGLSVVSDIDDTIKISGVGNTRRLLRNTFVNVFKPVPGMAAWYQRLLAQEKTGICFHYLSSSPMQLLQPLQQFLADEGFPAGCLHLRESTAWHSLLPGNGDSEKHKLGVLRQLLKAFPQRRFLLIGDSGEADPEIYAEVAREHPQQVEGIVIRDVTEQPAGATRYRETFAGLPPGHWHIIRDGDDGAALALKR